MRHMLKLQLHLGNLGKTDQPGHPPNVIRVLKLEKAYVLVDKEKSESLMGPLLVFGRMQLI